ncbi:DUF2309 domain-containing protein [Methylomonas sp. SURF-1]|uniref:Probable inorganic carbon transporter subunit DabA n=1 Tax=Methylomonas aurea TaxID=2952224 RepID=A0ABT1UKT9_9GAMM|nr:DUF2309 domain-containing protein [Methylomonas sp. SURF-1]MCQ8182850.1 DUF2309 domain-containing protein [Methylomonas sp. SURF-1]
MAASVCEAGDLRDIVRHAVAHLDHVLPGQAPIHDFVHHNTLHGFQHLPFEQALAEFTTLTGIDCYLPADKFREFYRQQRITDRDLDAALQHRFGSVLAQPLAGSAAIARRELYRTVLLHDVQAISPQQLAWRLGESAEFDIETAGGRPLRELWQAVSAKLALPAAELHPEDLLDLPAAPFDNELPQADDADNPALWFDRVGATLTWRGVLLALAGKDILELVRPQLIRLCASLLDEGLAAWRLPGRQELGLYAAWRQALDYDALPLFHDLAEWRSVTARLPEDAADAIVQQLQAMALPADRWEGYLRRLALELPGWSGLINWRQQHPDYREGRPVPVRLADYLAIRLVLDRLYAQSLCRSLWHCPAQFDRLQAYFEKHQAEFGVRRALFAGELPEYLAQAAQQLASAAESSRQTWQTLAQRILSWRQSPLAAADGRLNAHDHGWRLFSLCRNLGLGPDAVSALEKSQLLAWLTPVDEFDEQQRASVWLDAYERHYRQDLLQALHANHGRGRWQRRERRPQAQVFFCMDEREESFRRHLEEWNPAIETLGAAGFFGVAMDYQGLDDHHPTPLCPVVVTPAHRVAEVCLPSLEDLLADHRAGLNRAQIISDWLHQTLRRHLLRAYPLLYLFAPLKLVGLLGKTLWPDLQYRLEQAWQARLVPAAPTRLQFTAGTATPAAAKPGFSDEEQAQRVGQFLRTTGLSYGFARIVAILGHGSTSQNNPHEAAHDCGACGGRRGGPNARVFAAMANRPQVRALLAGQGIAIPDDTWFVGGQHDTCSDAIVWYDADLVPAALADDFTRLQADLAEADRRAAAERCRRFASSGYPVSPVAAFRHVQRRAADLSQVRPEFGHATNAAAFIGRRAATQGVFFDRRLFLISYDPTQDGDGTILENILLTAGPVGAGINLEYYFSTVNNDRLGCGTKIPHNVTGLFGVMEGAFSDLRTGLPLQMVEIHEAMRLQIVVEAKTETLARIYARQPVLQELVGGGWVHLNALDPDDGRIFVFDRREGFLPWQPEDRELPLRDDSAACYVGQTQAVAPILVRQPDIARE